MSADGETMSDVQPADPGAPSFTEATLDSPERKSFDALCKALDEGATMHVVEASLGRIGYDAYAESTGGKTFDGRKMPTFDEVAAQKPHVAKAWEDAAKAIVMKVTLARLREWTPRVGLTFGGAIAALCEGKRCARAGWNGKGMWIALTPGSEIPPASARDGAALHEASLRALAAGVSLVDITTPIKILPHIDMKAADGSLVIGWLASQTDMLAEDWTVL